MFKNLSNYKKKFYLEKIYFLYFLVKHLEFWSLKEIIPQGNLLIFSLWKNWLSNELSPFLLKRSYFGGNLFPLKKLFPFSLGNMAETTIFSKSSGAFILKKLPKGHFSSSISFMKDQ